MGYIDFSFNGVNSRDMGVKSVRIEESVMNFPFVSDSSLATGRPMGRIDLSLHKIQRDNLVISLDLLLCDLNGNPKVWTQDDIYRIADWLITEEYEVLELGSQSGVMYNAILVNSDGLNHYANGGILTVEFSTNSPYGWSIPSKEKFNISGTQTIDVVSRSNAVKYYSPYMEIKKIGNSGKISITNSTTGDKSIEIVDMYLDETIILDNGWELVSSDKPMATLHDRFNYEWLRLRKGSNQIKVEGDCEITFTHQYPVVAQWR